MTNNKLKYRETTKDHVSLYLYVYEKRVGFNTVVIHLQNNKKFYL